MVESPERRPTRLSRVRSTAPGRHIVVRVEEVWIAAVEAAERGFLGVHNRIRSMIVSSRTPRPASTNISTIKTKRKGYLWVETKIRADGYYSTTISMAPSSFIVYDAVAMA